MESFLEILEKPRLIIITTIVTKRIGGNKQIGLNLTVFTWYAAALASITERKQNGKEDSQINLTNKQKPPQKCGSRIACTIIFP
jgi:hypothetical protein